MKLNELKAKAFYKIRKKRHIILAATGIVAFYGSIAFAIKEGPIAFQIMEQERARRFEEHESTDISFLEATRLTWKCYKGTITCATFGTAAIVCSIIDSENKYSNLALAYEGVRQMHEEYKAVTKETVSANKYKTINETIAQKRLDESDIGCCEIVGLREGYLIEDEVTGRFFRMTTEAIFKIGDKMNEYFDSNWCKENGVAPVLYWELNDLWEKIGLTERKCGKGRGWEKSEPIEIWFEPGVAPNGEPCFVMYTNAYELGI